MRQIALALALVLAVTSMAYARPRGKKYKQHTIHGRGYDKHAIEQLLDDSEVPAEVTADERGVQKLKGKFKLDKSMKVKDAAVDFIDQHRNAFKLKDPKKELKLLREEDHKEGDIHVRYQQTYNGIPVWGQEVIVHINKKHELDRVIADNVPTPEIDTTPLVTSEEALGIVMADIDKRNETINKYLASPKSKLTIYSVADRCTLCYAVNISTVIPTASWLYFVNAKDGSILFRVNEMDFDGPISGTGVFWNGTTINLSMYEKKGGIYLARGFQNTTAISNDFVFNNATSSSTTLDDLLTLIKFRNNKSISAWDANGLPLGTNTVMMKDPNCDAYIGHNENNGRLTSGVNILSNHTTIYGYFKSNYNWEPWNNIDGSLIGVAHSLIYVGKGYTTDNAAWDPDNKIILYGDGDGLTTTDYTQGLDIAAHEIGHAITSANVGLNKFGPAGALNEHISDVWGLWSIKMISYSGKILLQQIIQKPLGISRVPQVI